MGNTSFIDCHDLWTHDQKARAREVLRQVEIDELHLIRLVWADPHGAARAKSISPDAFRNAMSDGYNINVATSTLDASGGRIFSSFVPGGGMNLDEMTGSPNLVIVPDPNTYRDLPWAPGVGWVLCDEYFRDGRPFHFSSRHLLRKQITRLNEAGFQHVVGLEVEWYLSKVVQQQLEPENTGIPGKRGRPIETAPIEPGYSYHSETNLDIMQPMISDLANAYTKLGLPLRSIENEYGPGQIECTFAAEEAMRAADDYVLFRTATRQVCRRLGYFATFMSCPGLPGHFPSGWHLHQSLFDKDTNNNLLTPTNDSEILSETGKNFLSGLLKHSIPATIFSTPTINGFRRFKPNSLAPNRVTWGYDHRGVLMRVISQPNDTASRIENRAGEPSANPYLFIASQIAAGLDGLLNNLTLDDAEEAPYTSDCQLLPTTFSDGLNELENDNFYRNAFGNLFLDYYLALKNAELDRFQEYCDDKVVGENETTITEWEQNEYYDFF